MSKQEKQEILDQEVKDCFIKINQLGITRQAVAESLGIDLRTVVRWASGGVTPRIKTKEKLKKFVHDSISPTTKNQNDYYNRIKRVLNEEDIIFLQKISRELEPITLKLAFRLLALRKIETKID